MVVFFATVLGLATTAAGVEVGVGVGVGVGLALTGKVRSVIETNTPRAPLLQED